MRGAYYNEFDPKAAAWLRELIKRNLIADGEVDERSIKDVQAKELRRFKQCHFFAGIGVWSFALRLAGWPDDQQIWTGSCPCQPFSVSGKRGGASDERHLWPAWNDLIRESNPELIFGEQVASDDGLAWLDLVHADLEGQGYTVGAVDTCAAGVGAPHIRQRCFFMADAGRGEHRGRGRFRFTDGAARESQSAHQRSSEARRGEERQRTQHESSDDGAGGELGDPSGSRCEGDGLQPLFGKRIERKKTSRAARPSAASGRAVGNAEHDGHSGPEERSAEQTSYRKEVGELLNRAGFTSGFWRGPEWIWCRDQEWRPVEPGTFPLAHGAAERVGRLRGYGNAICAEQAAHFIRAAIEEIRSARQ